MTRTMDLVGKLAQQLRESPSRFRARDGYDQLLVALREGHPPSALKQLLNEGPEEVAGDLLWVVAELEDVETFVPEACRHLSSSDTGTVAYAMEILLRGAQESAYLRAAFEKLRACHDAVCEHAVRTLVGEGLNRVKGILEA